MKKEFELISRAIVVSEDGKILICRLKNANFWFLPGGHVEFGETSLTALKREFKEELGAQISKAAFLQTIENIFTQNGEPRHEVNFLYLIALKSPKSKTLEPHLEFEWVDMAQLKKTNLLPKSIKNLILKP